jgi:hypothetical protein
MVAMVRLNESFLLPFLFFFVPPSLVPPLFHLLLSFSSILLPSSLHLSPSFLPSFLRYFFPSVTIFAQVYLSSACLTPFSCHGLSRPATSTR